MATIVHRHPEDLRSGSLRLAALLVAVATLLATIIIVRQIGGDDTASRTATAPAPAAAVTVNDR